MVKHTEKSGVIRGIARSFFTHLWERGLSANKALSWLRERGLGYRRQDFLRDYSQGKERYELASKVRFVNLDATPSEKILSREYHGVPDKYSFMFKYTIEGDKEGEEIESYFYLHTNRLTSRRELELKAKEYLEENKDRYQKVISNPSLRMGYMNPVYG